MAKELVPIVLSCAVWDFLIAKKTTVFQCNNCSLVEAINKGSSKDLMVMHLLRFLWFFTAFFDMQLITTHIAGVTNEAADMLSRDQANQFLRSHPQVSPVPTGLPPRLLQQQNWIGHLPLSHSYLRRHWHRYQKPICRIFELVLQTHTDCMHLYE